MKAHLTVMAIAVVASTPALSACSGGDETRLPGAPPACVENLNVDCTELLHDPPVYATIFRDLIQPQCAVGSGCHGADGAMGGLVLADADETYDTLLGLKGGTKRVLPGDPACSPLMVRLESRDPNFVMPRGSRLPDPALCDFVQWIKRGAQRN
jgi:Planctomycete cytochrome C